MKKFIFVFLSLLISCDVFAQAGGFPPVSKKIIFTPTVAGGCASGSPQPWTAVITGKITTIQPTGLSSSCASNGATNLVFGNIPTSVLPSNVIVNRVWIGICRDSSTDFEGCTATLNGIANTVTLYKPNNSAWTASGTKDLVSSPPVTFISK